MPDPKQDLEQQMQETQAQLDKELATDTTQADTTTTDDSGDTQADTATDTQEDTTPDDTTTTDDTNTEDDEAEKVKKKLTESTREAHILHTRNKLFSEASETPEPTEEEVKLEYPEWDEMDATQRKLAKDNLWNNRRFAKIDQVAKESKDIDAWNTKVDTFITDPKSLLDNPELEGKQEAFKQFAGKPTRRGLDIEDIVLAFLWDVAKNRPAPKKGQMFEGGSSGPNESTKPADDKISVEDAAILMNKDYNKYKEYLIAGKIKSV